MLIKHVGHCPILNRHENCGEDFLHHEEAIVVALVNNVYYRAKLSGRCNSQGDGLLTAKIEDHLHIYLHRHKVSIWRQLLFFSSYFII